MFNEGFEKAGDAAAAKANRLKNNFGGFVSLSLLAGFYIGTAMMIACVVAARTPDAPDKFLMGLGFSVGLIFVVFAGAELFTGNVLTMTLALLAKKTGFGAVAAVLAVSFALNLAGGWLTALVVWLSGILNGGLLDYMAKVVSVKVSLSFTEAFFRALLCNFFVTLGVWMSWLAKAEGARIALCIAAVFAFVVCGYEHVVANAFLLPAVWLAGGMGIGGLLDYSRNMAVVGLGNLTGGVLLAVAYYSAGRNRKPETGNRRKP